MLRMYGLILVALAGGCQLVAKLEDRSADPVSSGCSLPPPGATQLRVANLVPSATNADFCIRTSGSLDWGRPVFRDGGTGEACQAGLAYAGVTIPFGAPSTRVDVKAIPAGGPCSQAATSEVDGVTLGAGVTTIARMGGGSAQVPELLGAFPEEPAPDPTALRVRVINAVPGGPPIELGTARVADPARAANITLPAQASAVLFLRPVAFGQTESPGPSATVFAVDDEGYMQFNNGGFAFVIVPAGETNGVVAWYQSGGAFTKTLYAIGDPTNLQYAVRGLYCNEVSASTANPLLADCVQTSLPTLAVDTMNVGLYGAESPAEPARKPLVYKALQTVDADLLCLLETSEPDANANIVSALQAAGMPYLVNPQTQLTTPPTDPTDWNGQLVPPALQTPPCGGKVPPDDFAAAFNCAVQSCNTSPGVESGTIQGPLACLTSNCVASLIPLYDMYPVCLDCLVFNIASLQTYIQTRQNCTQTTTYPLTEGGANTSLIASRLPFAKNQDGGPATDVYVLPSSESRRTVLHARVSLDPADPTDTVDFFCGSLTTPFLRASVPYDGNYSNGTKYPDEPSPGTNGWRDEQNLQVRQTIAWVQSLAAGRPTILAGDWHASEHYPKNVAMPSATSRWSIGDLSPEVAQRLDGAFLPAHLPDWAFPCTYCSSASMGGPPNVYTPPFTTTGLDGYDFITTYLTGPGFSAASVTDESLTFTTPVVVYDPSMPMQLGPISEYYGRRVRLIRPR